MPSAPLATSISSDPVTVPFGARASLRVMGEIARTIAVTRIKGMGLVPYTLTWVMFPVFQLLLIALIYRENQALLDYGVVAGAFNALMFTMLFNAGEILDGERGRGTLGNLFLAPCPRFVWLAGFQLFALIEATATSLMTLAIGIVLFDVEIAPNAVVIVVTMVFFIPCLWGFSMIAGAVGVLMRDANLLSNMLFPFLMLLSGMSFPIALAPDWVRIIARGLPFGYGIQALVDALTKDASLMEIRSELIPLAGFAIAFPALGILAFRAVERAVRRMGYLELS